ncbi:MAG: glycosyltransferase family 9 protein [Desulfonatronovibrionaceae bacterium]
MPETFAVVRLGSLGDVVLTTGVLKYWNKRLGHSFVVISRSAWTEVFTDHPEVEDIVPVSAQNLSLRGWMNLGRRLRHQYGRLELIDLHANLRTLILRSMWPARTHVYSKLSLARRLYALTKNKHFTASLLSRNIPQRYAAALSGPVPPRAELVPELFLKPEEIRAAQSLLKPGRTTICLHPYATHQAKQWPAGHWKKLIQLIEDQGWSWLIIGRGTERLFFSHQQDLTGRTSIRQTAALLSLSQALVTADSGPMHLATGAKTPVVALFGPTTREWGFFPSGPVDQVLEADLKCRPCSLHGSSAGRCSGQCMNFIQPEQVMKTLHQICRQNSSNGNSSALFKQSRGQAPQGLFLD